MLGLLALENPFFIKKLVDYLRERGDRFEIIARCHVSSKALGGMTADKFILSKLGSMRAGSSLIVEEAGQVPHYIWCQLFGLFILGIRFIILGDIANQLAPVSDTFGGKDLELKADASFLRIHTNGNRLTLLDGEKE